ncbi:MAG TPA: SDR family NAD(P)-dependent oxidoreductase [Mycobacteriales bacterium]|nr:SDR family NAD(P)-dependent oxidoreductase [Mycobacteriales bacterium]
MTRCDVWRRGTGGGFRGARYSVVGSSRSIEASEAPDFVTVRGDVAQAAAAQRIVDVAVDRFGRVDTLINNAGILHQPAVHRLHVRRLLGDHRGQPDRVLPGHASRRPAAELTRWVGSGRFAMSSRGCSISSVPLS